MIDLYEHAWPVSLCVEPQAVLLTSAWHSAPSINTELICETDGLDADRQTALQVSSLLLSDAIYIHP